MSPLPESLPTVEEVFIADVTKFVDGMALIVAAAHEAASAVEDLQRTIDTLHGKTVDIGVETAGAGAASMAAATNAAADSVNRLAADLSQEGVAARAAAAANDEVTKSVTDVDAAYRQALIANTEFDRGLIEAWAAAQRMNIGMTDSAAAVTAAGAAAGVAAGGWRIFGVAAGTVLHWVVAAGAEFLAVAIPASVALGAALLVAAQGAQMVQQHMSALYAATEATANMFHVTIGSALGLRSALQQAQDQANPIVWSVLGAAINIAKSNFQDLAGAGLQVMRIFQTFSAEVVADFQSGFGTQIHGLLSGMVSDLTQFGQILGSVGHAVLNFAAAMPGLAEVLLRLIDGASQVLLWVSKLPPVLITVAMAMEETWRWGGLLAGIFTRIPTLIAAFVASGFGIIPVFTRVGAIFQSLALIIPRLGVALGTGLIALSGWSARLGEAGVAIGTFSEGVTAAIAGLSALQAGLIGAGVLGIGILIDKLATAQTYTQRLAASMQEAADKASGADIFPVITANLEKLIPVQAQANQQWQNAQKEFTQTAGGMGKLAGVMAVAKTNVQAASAAVTQQQQDMINASQAVGFLVHAYGVSFVGALELGTQAGVQWDQGIGRMSVAADINRLKVLDLMAGYKAMGQSAGAVGMDMTAIAIQSGLQATKIQQLTQAWQSYMGLLTGGTNSLATFEQGLQNIGTVAASSAGTLFEAQGKMNASTQKFAASLQSFTGKGAQNWQNFNQVVTTGAEGFINWMQTAGAVGAVKGGQMAGAIKGVVAQLIPFASKSQAARAELAGLAAQTGAVVAPTTKALEAWAKGGMNAQQLGKFVQDATAKLTNMAGVAQALGNVMQNDLVAMFDKARIAASGLPGALNTLSTAMHTSGTSASTMQGDILAVIQRLLVLHTSVPTISALLNSMGVNLSAAGVQALITAAKLSTTGNSVSTASGKMAVAAGNARALAAAIAALQSKTIVVTTIQRTVMETFSFHSTLGPSRQGGGPVAAGAAYLVGEQGPELFFPHASGNILSNPQSQRFLSNPGASSHHAAYTAAGGGAPAQAVIHNHVFLDGQQIWENQQQRTLSYNVRNGNPQSGRVAPGASFG